MSMPASKNTAALLAFARRVAVRCRAEVQVRGDRMPHETEQLLLMLIENAEMFLARPRAPLRK